MFTFAYPAKLTAGRDGRVLVEFVDLPRVATDGKNPSLNLADSPHTNSESVYEFAAVALALQGSFMEDN